MPNKRKVESPTNPRRTKPFRQTTLFESISPERPRPSAPQPSRSVITPGRQKRKRISESSDSSDIGAIKLEATPARKTSDNLSQSPLPSRDKRRRKLVIETESEESEEQEEQEEQETGSNSSKNSDSGTVIKPQRRLRRLARNSSDSDEQPASHSRIRPRRKFRKQENTVADEDLDMPSDEIEEDRIIPSRLRDRSKKTAFQKNLERLKRKKQGKPMSSSESSEENDKEESEEDVRPFKGARPSSSHGSLFSGEDDNNESDGSSSFIVEDDNQDVSAQLPSQFSMRSHEDLSHQFKIIFQFFVHIAVQPPADRGKFMKEQMKKQEYFSFPLAVTRRKLSGIRDSLVASSTWRPKFKQAIEKYPLLELAELQFAVPSCDACHLGGRLSTIQGNLGGIPYNKEGFIEELSSDSDSDSGESDGSVTRFTVGRYGFLQCHLGRFCARRVKVYHEFVHWEYHLYETIRSELDKLDNGKCGRGYVQVGFNGTQPPDDRTDADALCEWLDARGIIDREWQIIKTMIEDAHKLELSAKRGDVD